MIRFHIKNNRPGEGVFRITPALWRAACARHPDLARDVKARIDWDLDNFDSSMKTANALITWDFPTEDLARRAPNLKWIHIIGAGIEHLQPLDWLPKGVTLTNNRGVHAEKAGQYGAMALLMLNQKMPELFTMQRKHRWHEGFTGSITGKTFLVVGAGHMGTAVAISARKLGLEVTGIRRSGKAKAPYSAIHPPKDLDRLLPGADFVLLTTPLTAETRGLFDEKRIAHMKPGAGLINMGRGPLINHGALVKALWSGHLSGAILDVHDPEPLPKTSKLWDAPNLIITPHVSSDDHATYIPLTLDLVFRNLARLKAGRPLLNKVRPELGY